MTKQPLIPVLITRAAPQAQRFALALDSVLAGQMTVLLSPLMQAEDIDFVLPEQSFGALVLTSETGAEAAGRLILRGQNLPKLAFCVGDRTAEAAQKAGFTPLSAAGDARDLQALILQSPDPGPMLYLHGADRAADLGTALKGQREVVSAVIYRQIAQDLSPEALALLARPGPVIAPIFSPRSARLLAKALPKPLVANLFPVTISANATAALPQDLANIASTATRPDAEAMRAAVIVAINRLTATGSP